MKTTTKTTTRRSRKPKMTDQQELAIAEEALRRYEAAAAEVIRESLQNPFLEI
jgi:hypothetical protein